LNEEEVTQVMTGEGVTFGRKKNAVYTPALVLWGLLWQALATGAERSYETALLRSMLDRFQRGDVVLAGRYYTSYFMVALLLARGVDVVFRQHQRRVTNYRQGKRLGAKDHVVSWSKPACPTWMDQAMYARCRIRYRFGSSISA